MLRISFHQFRCWEDLQIEAPIGGITLIKGASGVGKTTILQGITWCLYGNIRLVAPNHMEKAKTRVVLELPYTYNGVRDTLSINRQRNPNRLLLSHTGIPNQVGTQVAQVYEDKVAQAIIDDMFGTYDIWLASCYIGQGCRNGFLTAPNTGKMELLNSIAFHEEDPTTYIERIDTVLTETDTEYKTKLALFTNNLNSLQGILADTDVTKALTPEQISEVNSQINTLSNEKAQLQLVKNQQDVDLGILDNLRRQLGQINGTAVKVSDPDATLIAMNIKYEGDPLETSDQIDTNVARALNVIPILQRRDDLQAEVRRFDSLLLPYVNFNKDTTIYSNADYQNAVSKETAQRDNQRLAHTLGVLYSENAIKETIQRHQNVLAAQDRLKLEQERDTLQHHIAMLEMEHVHQTTPLVFPDVTPQEISIPDYSKYSTEALALQLNELSQKQGALQAHIQHLQKGHDVLECPHCKGPVRYQQGSLVTADTGPTTRDEILTAQQQQATINIEITKVRKSIQDLNAAEAAARVSYDETVALEQRRINSLREKVRLLELEKQRRDIANQTRVKNIQDQKDKLQNLVTTISDLPDFGITDVNSRRILSQKEIADTHSLIGRLSSIVIVGAPTVSSQHIQSYLNYQDLMQRNAAALLAYDTHFETIPPIYRNESTRNIQTYIDRLRGYWNQIKQVAEERLRLERLKMSLEEQISGIEARLQPDPSPDIERINIELTRLRESLSLSQRAHQAIQYHTQISKEREEVVNLNNNISDLQVLRQHAVETECRILQQVVDSINASIQGVCGTLFDRDINITLNLFKTLKTTKNVKPVANFAISYQGGIFDNINQMSGGEGDRASLALTLALNRLSSCPLLMLDESLASLDLNMKEAAIRTIRENTNNTVFVILHDGIEGIFDHILNMDEIRETRPLA